MTHQGMRLDIVALQDGLHCKLECQDLANERGHRKH